MQGEKEFLCRVVVVRFLVKNSSRKFYTTCVVRNLVFEIHVSVELRQLFRDQAIGTS